MLALLHLELHRAVPFLPVLGIMILFGSAPILLNQASGASVSVAFIVMTSMVLVTRLFPFDSAENQAIALVGTLPVSRRQVVAARFVCALLVILFGSVLALVTTTSTEFTLRVSITAIAALAPLMVVAITGPLSSRGGLGAVGPAVPLLAFAALVMPAILMPTNWRNALLNSVLQAPGLSAGIGAGTMAALLGLSFALSVRWFERRDL